MPRLPLAVPSGLWLTPLDRQRVRVDLRRKVGLVPVTLPAPLPASERGL